MQDQRKHELAFKFVTGELTETQLNWWVVKMGFDREEMEALIEFHQKGVHNVGTAMKIFAWVMLLVLAALGILVFAPLMRIFIG